MKTVKNPSDMFRNLLGGFVGGTLGVLFAGFIHPLASPIGLLVGVLFGYWHDIILNRCSNVYEIVCRMNLGMISGKVLRRLCRQGKAWYIRRRRGFWRGLRQVSPALYCIGRALRWSVHAPFRGLAWLIAEPVRVMSILSVLLLMAASAVLLIVSYEAVPTFGSPENWEREIIAGILCLVSSMFVCASRDASKEHHAKVYASSGTVRYVAKSFFSVFVQLFATACIIGGMFSLMIVGIVSLLIVFFSSLIFFGILQGLWEVSSKRQHLLCLSVTAVVTITSVIVFRYSLHGSMLWIISLGTGMVSAVATEGARRLFLALLPRCGVEQYVGKDPFDLVDIPIKRVFGPASRWFEGDSLGNIVRRIFSW